MSPFKACKSARVEECSEAEFAFVDFIAFFDAYWTIAFGTIAVCVFYVNRGVRGLPIR
jgi:hypothetical protein